MEARQDGKEYTPFKSGKVRGKSIAQVTALSWLQRTAFPLSMHILKNKITKKAPSSRRCPVFGSI